MDLHCNSKFVPGDVGIMVSPMALVLFGEIELLASRKSRSSAKLSDFLNEYLQLHGQVHTSANCCCTQVEMFGFAHMHKQAC